MWCFACIRPGGVALVQGELVCVQGELFVVFRGLIWWFSIIQSLSGPDSSFGIRVGPLLRRGE
jgi:hypothetical protein